MNRPAVTHSQAWEFPVPHVTRLGNGLDVWYFPMPGQHIASFDLVLPASLADEPTTAEGVGAVALNASDEGTLSHPDGAIGELLEAHGATLHGAAHHHHTTFGGVAPSTRLGDALPLFLEVLREPEYADQDVTHHVEGLTAAFDSKVATPETANRMALRAALFGGDHREGRPASGTPSTLLTITPDDVRAWHQAHYGPAGATLLIAGAAAPDAWFPLLEAWSGQAIPAPRPTPAPTLPPSVVVVDQPGAVQATISLATRTPTRDDPRWPQLRVAGHAVAGAFASRLNLELRERLGYSYGIGGGFSPGVAEGMLLVGGSVRTEVAGDSVARLLDGLALAAALTDEEVADARNYLISVAPLANETSSDIVAQASALAAAGLAPGYLHAHFAQLARVTPGEATAAWRDVVSPDQVTIAVSGDADSLLPALARLGLAPQVVDLQSWS